MSEKPYKRTPVLQVNKLYYPWTGGIETVARDISKVLKNSDGFEVTALVCVPKGRAREDRVDEVRVVRSASWGMLWGMPVSFNFLFKFRRLVKESKVIFLHHPFPLGFLAHLLFGRKKRVVVWYHSDIVRQKFLGFLLRPVIQAVLKKAEKIFVSSHNLKNFSKPLSRYRDKCVVIPFGLDANQYEPDRKTEVLIREIKNKYGGPLILGVGRLVYYKGFEYLIRAVGSIPEAKLLIVGDGPLRGKLSELAKSEGLIERFHLLGRVDNLIPYYHACDVFVLPSVARSEAFGLVQLEAMACGKPVINTNLSTGVPEVSLNKITGFTVLPRDVRELTESLNWLLVDKDLREKMGMAARERVRNHFSRENFARLLLRALSD